MYKEILLHCTDLYKKISTHPMTEVAKHYGVSDKGTSKICNKFNIPVPELGYWRKVEGGRHYTKV